MSMQKIWPLGPVGFSNTDPCQHLFFVLTKFEVLKMLNFAFISFYPRRVWHFKKKKHLANFPECFLLGLIPGVLLWLLLEL